MNLKKEIENYVPINMQEERDKQFILEAFNTFDDILNRDNNFIHFTSSAFVVNKNRDKVLMVYHNIYKSWCWIGGHADGEEDLLEVAKREVKEETSIKNIKVLCDGRIMSIDSLPVVSHVKRGKNINAHIHLSVAYIFEVDENEEIKIKPDENSNVKWLDIDRVVELSTEPHMKVIYQKMINKVKQMN